MNMKVRRVLEYEAQKKIEMTAMRLEPTTTQFVNKLNQMVQCLFTK